MASTAWSLEHESTPMSPNLLFGGPSWPGVGCSQRLAPVGCSGLDSQLLGTILGPFGFFGPCHLSEYLNHFEILEIQFFSNSPQDYAHWIGTAILCRGVQSV